MSPARSPQTARGRYVLIGIIVIALLAIVAPVSAAVILSSSGGDDSARLASAITNAAASDSIVILNPGLFYAHGVSVSNSVTIRAADGHGFWDTIIDGSRSGDRIFTTTTPGTSIAIDNLTIRNGVNSSTSGNAYGGAIYATGSVTVTSSTFTGCSASGGRMAEGGAIYDSGGSVTVTTSTLSGCSVSCGEAGDLSAGGAIRVNGGSVDITSSTFTGCSATKGAGAGDGSVIFAGSGAIRSSRIYHNTLGTAVSIPTTDTWWGSNSNPSSRVYSGVTYSPWRVLGATASPSSITPAGTSTISANLTYDTNGATVSAVTEPSPLPDGIPVTFTATGGTVSPASAFTANGIATTTFTHSGTGTAYITATVDDESVTVPVTVISGGPTMSIETDPSDASTVYAGVDGSGVYRSMNSGSSWTAATTQPANTKIRALAINPVARTTIYTRTYGGGVYKSTNSGVTWSACTATANPYVLSLVTNSTGGLYAGTEGGVYASTDGCGSWTAVNNWLS